MIISTRRLVNNPLLIRESVKLPRYSVCNLLFMETNQQRQVCYVSSRSFLSTFLRTVATSFIFRLPQHPTIIDVCLSTLRRILTTHPSQRLKEMKQMSRDPRAADKARKAERRADEKSGAISIKPLSLASSDTKPSSGFKKGGFKNAFGSVDDEEKDEKRGLNTEVKVEGFNVREQEAESESDDDYDRYDPRRPTGCGEGCPGRG